MNRIILCAVIGSVLGGFLFFPPAIPISFTIWDVGIRSDTSDTMDVLKDLVFLLLPLIGLISGGLIGAIVGKKRISPILFKNISLSIMFWSICIFGLIGLETGFIFSFVTFIGLGNTSTAIDLWIFSGAVGIVGVILGVLVGLFAVFVYLAITDRPFGSAEVQ
jgi:surface polysaccharide O-acyltransferase-like enzyme